MGRSCLVGVEELSEAVAAGRRFFVAGDERALARLPAGEWVGGTIPYFLTEDGGVCTRDRLCAAEMPPCAAGVTIAGYDERSIADVYVDAPVNGYSLVVMPAGSRTLRAFALDAPRYRDFACSPLVGWVSGVLLDELHTAVPKVFDGRRRAALEDAALVMHVALPRAKTAEVGLFNMFEPGDGDVLAFPADSFTADEVIVNGERRPFVEYIRENGLDVRLPLVADYDGVLVNTSVQRVDEAAGKVHFYAPVFRGVRYRHARPVRDYAEAFAAQLPRSLTADTAFSCNCILNYLYAGLEGKPNAGSTGPATFGEVAYQLVNQTLVTVRVVDTNLAERLRGEMALRKQVDELGAMTRQLEAFNYMASHDLRAPLRHIRSYAQRLQRSPAAGASAEAAECVAGIERSADRMASLLDGMQRLARAERAELRRAPVDLTELAAEVRGELGEEGGGRRVAWEVAPLPVVRGDRALLREAFVNLVSNALKYSRGREEARIEIGAQAGEAEDIIYVRDNGVGFDPHAAGRLFEPFQRLVSAQEFPGSGMGLAIVARIAARHGGRVWAEGRPGEGACFYFALP